MAPRDFVRYLVEKSPGILYKSLHSKEFSLPLHQNNAKRLEAILVESCHVSSYIRSASDRLCNHSNFITILLKIVSVVTAHIQLSDGSIIIRNLEKPAGNEWDHSPHCWILSVTSYFYAKRAFLCCNVDSSLSHYLRPETGLAEYNEVILFLNEFLSRFPILGHPEPEKMDASFKNFFNEEAADQSEDLENLSFNNKRASRVPLSFTKLCFVCVRL